MIVGFAAMAIAVIVATVVSMRLLYPGAEPGLPAPTGAWLAVNFAYSLGAAALGGWLAAYLAPRAPFAHGAALAVGGTLVGGRLARRPARAGESR